MTSPRTRSTPPVPRRYGETALEALTEAELVRSTTSEGEGVGVLDVERLGAEVDALTEVGVFPSAPGWRWMVVPELAAEPYDGERSRWPS